MRRAQKPYTLFRLLISDSIRFLLSVSLSLCLSVCLCACVWTYTHTHTNRQLDSEPVVGGCTTARNTALQGSGVHWVLGRAGMVPRLTAVWSATSERLPQMRCFCLIHSPASSVDTVTLRASSPCRTGPSLGFILMFE